MSENVNHTFSILFVCTGNICRSPLGEFLLKDKLSSSAAKFTITSAGTHALLGGQVPQEIVDFARSQHVTIQEHEPREMTAEIIGNADLVLTAERSHRSEVVSLVPRASAKAYTLKQFARLAQDHEKAIEIGEIPIPEVLSLSDLVSELADFRSFAAPPETPSYDDIDDPYRKSFADYQLAGKTITEAVDVTAQILTSYSR